MSLSDLPDELIQIIGSKLNIKSFVNLSSSCKEFCTILDKNERYLDEEQNLEICSSFINHEINTNLCFKINDFVNLSVYRKDDNIVVKYNNVSHSEEFIYSKNLIFLTDIYKIKNQQRFYIIDDKIFNIFTLYQINSTTKLEILELNSEYKISKISINIPLSNPKLVVISGDKIYNIMIYFFNTFFKYISQTMNYIGNFDKNIIIAKSSSSYVFIYHYKDFYFILLNIEENISHIIQPDVKLRNVIIYDKLRKLLFDKETITIAEKRYIIKIMKQISRDLYLKINN